MKLDQIWGVNHHLDAFFVIFFFNSSSVSACGWRGQDGLSIGIISEALPSRLRYENDCESSAQAGASL